MNDPDVKPTARAPQDSPRKEELLRRSLDYMAEHSLSDLSLRPLAKAIGSSPRVLLYLFGSKDQLIRDVLALNRVEQLALLERALAGSDDPNRALQTLWEWLVDPARDNVRRLFFEAYIRSLSDGGTLRGFATQSIDDWLASFRPVIVRAVRHPDPEVEATLLLAVMRGLLVDLMASGDRDRVDRTWRLFLADRYPPAQ